jgi:metalloendopeptidase OMA1, mitochondrial
MATETVAASHRQWRRAYELGTDVMRLRRRIVRCLSAVAILSLVPACATVPYTGRSQIMMMSQSNEVALGADAYQHVLHESKIVTDPAITSVVRDVGERIARAANKPEYKWEFTVIDDPKQANAFALPGGKVAVYTGLFPLAHDTGGLATVMGHEVAHAIARHGAERMSQDTLLQIGAAGLAVGVGMAGQSAATQSAVMQAFGLGAHVGVMLPFGRSQEAEADHIGLILMAQAGYDPHDALGLWERFEQKGGSSPPEWLSTHPGYGTRQENIRGWLPEAERYYQPDTAAKIELLPTVAAK